MDELLDALLKAKEEMKDNEVQEAKEIAKMNKVLFDAHIEAGFTTEQAIKIVVAQNY